MYHKVDLQLCQLSQTPPVHYKDFKEFQPRETLFQSYMKGRLAKIKNIKLPCELSFRKRIITQQAPQQLVHQQLKCRVKKYITNISNTGTTKQRSAPLVKRKQSENWNELNCWSVDETIQ